MTSTIETPQENGRLLQLFEELLNSFPHGTATLVSKRTENDDGTIIWLKPSNQRAAEFGVHTADGDSSGIDVFFGNAGTTLEFPWEANLPEHADGDAVLEVVRSIGAAVVAGRCEERLGFMGIRGTIRVSASVVYGCTHYFYPRLYPKTVRYEPYWPAESKV